MPERGWFRTSYRTGGFSRSWLCSLALFLSFALASAGAQAAATQPTGLLGDVQQTALRAGLIGRWSTTLGPGTLRLVFEKNGRFTLGKRTGRFDMMPGGVQLRSDDGRLQTYQVDLAGDQLTLKGGDLAGALTFTRRTELTSVLSSWFAFSPGSLGAKAWHIMLILIIVMAARLVLLIAQWLSYCAVFSETGLFGLLYRRQKNRARTIHLLVLNLIKYVIYFTALGLILSEVGVNYTAYLASLSVIGLAIGFGSQGLVQDMVTGFFVLFEGQYDVGDMVDISGQTGVVSEIGLRMTRLRNYLGQTVVIPNRNIAVVGNYLKGAQAVSVDLTLTSGNPEDSQRAREAMQAEANRVEAEFAGVMIEPPTVQWVDAGEDAAYLRVNCSIWPGQAWLVDGQLIPRLKEVLAAMELTIQGDRVAAFYHAREIVEVGKGWRWAGRREAES